MKKVIVLLLIATFAFSAVSMAENKDDVCIQVLFTSDLHGAIVDSGYSYGDAETVSGTGLSRIATLIREYRAENPNTLLIDNGDTIQGTPLSYYYIFRREDAVTPAIRALRLLGYDIWSLGNHEFNYGLNILNKQISECRAPANGDEKSVTVLSANLVVQDATEYKPWQQPYTVKEYEGVRVGIIGMDTPCIPAGNNPEFWTGIGFRSFLSTWENYAEILKEQENCDIVIVCAHSGIGETGGELTEASKRGPEMAGEGLYYRYSYDDQIGALIENSTGIDLVIGGHTHEVGCYKVTDKSGKEIPVAFCGTKGQYLGVANIVRNGETGEITVTCETVDAKNVPPDETFIASMTEQENEVWEKYLNEEIGYASGDFVAPGDLTEANAFMELIHKTQLKSTGAQLSIASPLSSYGNVAIPEGKITRGRLFRLYIYENWLYNINMSGAEIKEWMEYAATKYYVREDGTVYCDLIYCDTLYGEGVSYWIDLEKEPGNRIQDIMYKGVPLDMDATYQVAINNYRFSGGGNYISNVSTMAPNDDSRVNFSTQYDMEQGIEKGQVRSLIEEYISGQGVIDPVVTSSFYVRWNKEPTDILKTER